MEGHEFETEDSPALSIENDFKSEDDDNQNDYLNEYEPELERPDQQ